MVRTIQQRYIMFSEVFHSRLPFYKLIELYGFNRNKPYEVTIQKWPGAEAYKVTQYLEV